MTRGLHTVPSLQRPEADWVGPRLAPIGGILIHRPHTEIIQKSAQRHQTDLENQRQSFPSVLCVCGRRPRHLSFPSVPIYQRTVYYLRFPTITHSLLDSSTGWKLVFHTLHYIHLKLNCKRYIRAAGLLLLIPCTSHTSRNKI